MQYKSPTAAALCTQEAENTFNMHKTTLARSILLEHPQHDTLRCLGGHHRSCDTAVLWQNMKTACFFSKNCRHEVALQCFWSGASSSLFAIFSGSMPIHLHGPSRITNP